MSITVNISDYVDAKALAAYDKAERYAADSYTDWEYIVEFFHENEFDASKAIRVDRYMGEGLDAVLAYAARDLAALNIDGAWYAVSLRYGVGLSDSDNYERDSDQVGSGDLEGTDLSVMLARHWEDWVTEHNEEWAEAASIWETSRNFFGG